MQPLYFVDKRVDLYVIVLVTEPVEGPVPHIEMLSKTIKINFIVQSPASDNSVRSSG